MDERIRALNRFGMGARPGETARLGDPRGWLEAQLTGPAEPPGEPLSRPADVWARIGRYRQAQVDRDREAARSAAEALGQVYRTEARAALTARLRSDRPFVERLVAFWSDHLCVSVEGKRLVAPLAGLYEREVVRPHVLGRFEDMVVASARHPAMLLYLDNFRSLGPDSPVARRAGRRRDMDPGLNENYARELMELHTVGVDGGYHQNDVEELARVLTGWGVLGVQARMPAGARPGFRFRPGVHQPGEKTVLGIRYGEGEAEGERAIRDLCRHPSTAAFLARKLVTHFVADDPPRRAVDRVEKAFRDSGGDLGIVSGTLVELEDAWDPGLRKFRTPQDWLVAVLRALGARELPEPALGVLQQLRQPLWSPPAPRGFGDLARTWADPDGLMNRAELARSVSRRVAGSGMEPTALLEVVDVAEDDPLPGLLDDDAIDRSERVALALAGPAFQWR